MAKRIENNLMSCGHIANAKNSLDNPCCVICDCDTLAQKQIVSLEGRKAKCNECNCVVDSDTNLAFFEYKPNEEFDSYYCGCKGWE